MEAGHEDVTSEVEFPRIGYKTPRLESGQKHVLRLIVKISGGAISDETVDFADVEIDSVKDGKTVTDLVVAYTHQINCTSC